MVELIYIRVKFIRGGIYKGGFVYSFIKDYQLYNLISELNLSLLKCIVSYPY